MGIESLESSRLLLESIDPTPKGIERLISVLGYSLNPEKQRPLDRDTLIQQKEIRERVSKVHQLFSIKGQWIHPETKQIFDREANILLFELSEKQALSLRWPFEITRYVARFGSPYSQGIFFFIAPEARSLVVTAYTQSIIQPEQVEVRRLLIEIDNITRTDIEAIDGLEGLAANPAEIVQAFRDALPYIKVGSSFFEEYHDLFQTLTKRLRKVFSKNEDAYGYAQRLLGRITFLYFLQRKGWLDGDKAYLKNRRAKMDGCALFDFLYKLFDKLNSEESTDKSVGKIPYLNGSLFDKEDYSKKEWGEVKDACSPLLSKIFEVLDDYNFTISESTPLDKEVAVDPELLGSIFESMLPETERGDKGTFYTHQDEMLFMAREALRVYLSRFPELLNQDQTFYIVYGLEWNKENKTEPRRAKEIKEKLQQIKALDPAVGSGGFLMALLQTLLDARKTLNQIIGGTKEQDYDIKLEIIEKNLFGVDIEHEAIELARLRLWLSLVVDEAIENVRPLPNLDYNLHQGDSLLIPDFEKKVQRRIEDDHTLLNALRKEIAITREEYAKSHGKDKEQKRNELEKALIKLIKLETGSEPPKPLPFSYKYFFPDVMAVGGFDAILMNPPYIRQEDIGRLHSQNPAKYKQQVVEDSIFITNNKFKPDKKSDSSIYFHIRALSLLKDSGVAVVIASSKWLDVGYGAPLQQYLLKNTALDCILESVSRSFSAMVNVVITLIQKGTKNPSQNLVRFAYFKRPFNTVDAMMIKDILTNTKWNETEIYCLRMKTQEELLQEGYPSKNGTINPNGIISLTIDSDSGGRNNKYVGSKWGNVWLRAPQVYFEIVRHSHDHLTRLQNISEIDIKRGLLTGCNDFFILEDLGTSRKKGLITCRNGFGYEFNIEEEFCLPILREPESVTKSIEKPTDLPHRVFYCRKNRIELKGTLAMEYIKWGESNFTEIIRGKDKGKKVRICDLSTVSSRGEWYWLSDTPPAYVALPIIVKNRHLVPRSNRPVLSTHNFDLLYSESPTDLWLYLNSMIFRMFMELYGRIEAPAVQLMVEEYNICPILKSLPTLSKKFKMFEDFRKREAYRIANIIEQGPLELEQPDRKELDDLVLKELGFTNNTERERVLKELYDWLQYHTRWRVEKPIHAPKGISSKGDKIRKGIQTRLE